MPAAPFLEREATAFNPQASQGRPTPSPLTRDFDASRGPTNPPHTAPFNLGSLNNADSHAGNSQSYGSTPQHPLATVHNVDDSSSASSMTDGSAISPHFLETEPELATRRPEVWFQAPNLQGFKRLTMDPSVVMTEVFEGAFHTVTGLNSDYYTMPYGTRVINIKTDTNGNFELAVRSGVWSTMEAVSKRIMKVWDARGGPNEKVLFLFALTGKKQYCALAEMSGPWDPKAQVDGFADGSNGAACVGTIPLTWLYVKNVPYGKFSGLVQKRTGIVVTNMWNGMHFGSEVGRKVIKTFVEAPHFSNVLAWPKTAQEYAQERRDARPNYSDAQMHNDRKMQKQPAQHARAVRDNQGAQKGGGRQAGRREVTPAMACNNWRDRAGQQQDVGPIEGGGRNHHPTPMAPRSAYTTPPTFDGPADTANASQPGQIVQCYVDAHGNFVPVNQSPQLAGGAFPMSFDNGPSPGPFKHPMQHGGSTDVAHGTSAVGSMGGAHSANTASSASYTSYGSNPSDGHHAASGAATQLQASRSAGNGPSQALGYAASKAVFPAHAQQPNTAGQGYGLSPYHAATMGFPTQAAPPPATTHHVLRQAASFANFKPGQQQYGAAQYGAEQPHSAMQGYNYGNIGYPQQLQDSAGSHVPPVSAMPAYHYTDASPVPNTVINNQHNYYAAPQGVAASAEIAAGGARNDNDASDPDWFDGPNSMAGFNPHFKGSQPGPQTAPLPQLTKAALETQMVKYDETPTHAPVPQIAEPGPYQWLEKTSAPAKYDSTMVDSLPLDVQPRYCRMQSQRAALAERLAAAVPGDEASFWDLEGRKRQLERGLRALERGEDVESVSSGTLSDLSSLSSWKSPSRKSSNARATLSVEQFNISPERDADNRAIRSVSQRGSDGAPKMTSVGRQAQAAPFLESREGLMIAEMRGLDSPESSVACVHHVSPRSEAEGREDSAVSQEVSIRAPQ